METGAGDRLGPVGRRLAENIKDLRSAAPRQSGPGRDRSSVRELSALLDRLGRPILPSGITKLEQGQRRVDADDLLALAYALDVTPNRLLLRGAADEELISLSPEVETPSAHAWQWACGEHPLQTPWPARRANPELPDTERNATNDEALRQIRWRQENRPHDPPLDFDRWPHELHRQHTDEVWKLVDQFYAVQKLLGVSSGDLVKYLRGFEPKSETDTDQRKEADGQRRQAP